MEVGPRIFALRPQDRDIIDLLISPDAQACCLNTGRIIYFAYPMPIDVLEFLSSEELYQLHQHLDGNANLYSTPISDDWRDIRSRIISHLSARGFPLPQRSLLTFMGHFQDPANIPSRWTIPVLDFVLGGMKGPAPYDIMDSYYGKIEVGMKLPNGKRIAFDPKKDTPRGAIEKANELGELNKYLDAMDWGVPIPVYKKGRDVFRDGASGPETLQEVVVWYRWLEDPSCTFGGQFVPLVRNTDAGVDVGRSTYREERFLKALDQARRFFLDSGDNVLEGHGLERASRDSGSHRQHRQYAGPSINRGDSALPKEPIPEKSGTQPEDLSVKKLQSHQKESVPFDHGRLCAFHRKLEAMDPSAPPDSYLYYTPPVHTHEPHSHIVNGKRYTQFRKYDPEIHRSAILHTVSESLTQDARDHCELIHKNFGTEYEIEEMVLLYDIPPSTTVDTMEIPGSLLDYIGTLSQKIIRHIMRGSIMLHWDLYWCPVQTLNMPFEQLSMWHRHWVTRRRGRGAVDLKDQETPELNGDSSIERDDPQSLDSIQKAGSSRTAHQHHESCVENAAGPSTCETIRPTGSEGSPHPVQKCSSNMQPSRTEGESNKAEAKVQSATDQQQRELPVQEIDREDTKEQIHELQACTPQPQTPETRPVAHVPSDALSTADENTQPTVINDPATNTKKHSQSNDGKDEADAPRLVAPQQPTVESPSASEAGEDKNLVSEEKENSGPHQLSSSTSDQEWSLLSGGYES